MTDSLALAEKNPLARLEQDPWLVLSAPLLTLNVPSWGKVKLDTTRFGRAFQPFSSMLRIARINAGFSEVDLAKAIGKDRSVICRLEASGGDKLHASSDLIQQLAVGLGLEPLESYIAYVSDVRPFHRVLAYPDDPGSMGGQFGLPLPGALTRLQTRPKP